MAIYAVSVAVIGLLAWLDPKRRRRLRGSPAVRWLRALAFALLPASGALLLAADRWATFVIWVGVLCIAGWMAAHAAKWPLWR